MAPKADSDPFILQPVLAELYTTRDLLDFGVPALPTPTPSQPVGNAASALFSSVSQFAAGVTGGTPPPLIPPESPVPSSTASPPGSVRSPTSPLEPQVRCVEGYTNNLYVGGTDGVVEWWTYDGSGTSEERGWKLQNKLRVSGRSISRIVLLPKVGKCFILSEGTAHPYTLPSLDPIMTSGLPSIKGVVSIALNDDELDLGIGDGEGMTDMTVVIMKRKGLLVCRLGASLKTVKEMPLPGPSKTHGLFSTYLCAALPTESGLNYCLVDLSDASLTELLPVSQVPQEPGGYRPNPNVVVIPGENQFLVTSYTGAGTMGVFLNAQGDPERGTMEWTDHPLSIAVESGYIIALLRNNTITIHELANLDRPAQVIPLDSTFEAFGLSYSPYGVSIRDVVRDERMTKGPFTLLSGKLESSSPLPTWGISLGGPVPPPDDSVPEEALDNIEPEEEGSTTPNEDPPSGSGLTPPSSPKFKKQELKPPGVSSLLSSPPAVPGKVPFSSAIAETLLVGRHKVWGLTPTPPIIRLERLCAERKVDQAADLVDEERRRGRRGEIEVDKATHNATLRLLHLYLACHLLLETVFERAGDYFVRGKVDPRLVVRLFPAFRGKVIGSAEEVEMLEGVRPVFADMSTIDHIIKDFINRNATDHGQAEKEELHGALYDSAKNMLTEFLGKTRVSRRKGSGARGIDSHKIDIVIDTTFAKLLADAGLTNELLTLLAGPNDVVLQELEPFLAKRKSVLVTVMRQQGNIERVLALLKEIAEDPTSDPLCRDPVREIVQELDTIQDPELLRPYTLWLIKRNPEQGLSILMAKGNKIKVDDRQLIQDLAETDKNVSDQYLEYVVVGKQSTDRALHELLLSRLLEQAEEMVKDDGIQYHLEELDAEYRLLPEPQAYPVFFAEIAPSTPFRTMRLKLMFFLQSSPLYDLDDALNRLESIKVLLMEKAIVLGRLNNHGAALALLVRALPDSVSAQTYCTQGGEILPPKLAREVVANAPELAAWASFSAGRKRRGTVDADTQHRLVRELLGAYMHDGGNTTRTAELLSAQGVHLDTLEVLDKAPKDWPLEVITTFYKRSLRRQMHERAKWQILKSMSAGQNLEMSQRYLDAIQRIPPVIEDKPEGDLVEKEEPLDEKVATELDEMSLSEKEAPPPLPNKELEVQEMRPMRRQQM